MIRKSIVLLLMASVCAAGNVKDQGMTGEEMMSDWRRMNRTKEETAEWFQDARFGMFIHFGLYSIPAGVWKGKKIEDFNRPPHVAEWIQYVAQIPREEYAKLAAEFNPVKYNADSIAKLAVDAGMKYIVITSKHHDGFAMYDSKVSKFDVMDASPFKRDIVAELYQACKKYGLGFGVYYSHNIDWADGGDCQYAEVKKSYDEQGKDLHYFGANLWDPSPNTFQEYLDNKAIPQVKELLNKFPGMKCMWYDMSRFMFPEQSYRFYKTTYDIQPQVIVTNRIGNDFGDYIITGDNLIPEDPAGIDRPWETVGTLNNSWGYKSYDHDWKSAEELIFWLVEIASKGGNYMLNIGPKGDGEVPPECVERLREIGKWMNVNGEAIYSSGRWIVNHEGPTIISMDGTDAREKVGFKNNFKPDDFWFTRKDNKVYAIALAYPEKTSLIKNLGKKTAGKIRHVRMLGIEGPVVWKQRNDGLEVSMPERRPCEYGYALEITL